jgi:hypothetical protein
MNAGMFCRLLAKGMSLARRACIAPMNRWPVAALWQVPQTIAANASSPLRSGRGSWEAAPGRISFLLFLIEN